MLRDGLIVFEGDADALRRSTDPYIQNVSLVKGAVPFGAPLTRGTAPF